MSHPHQRTLDRWARAGIPTGWAHTPIAFRTHPTTGTFHYIYDGCNRRPRQGTSIESVAPGDVNIDKLCKACQSHQPYLTYAALRHPLSGGGTDIYVRMQRLVDDLTRLDRVDTRRRVGRILDSIGWLQQRTAAYDVTGHDELCDWLHEAATTFSYARSATPDSSDPIGVIVAELADLYRHDFLEALTQTPLAVFGSSAATLLADRIAGACSDNLDDAADVALGDAVRAALRSPANISNWIIDSVPLTLWGDLVDSGDSARRAANDNADEIISRAVASVSATWAQQMRELVAGDLDSDIVVVEVHLPERRFGLMPAVREVAVPPSNGAGLRIVDGGGQRVAVVGPAKVVERFVRRTRTEASDPQLAVGDVGQLCELLEATAAGTDDWLATALTINSGPS